MTTTTEFIVHIDDNVLKRAEAAALLTGQELKVMMEVALKEALMASVDEVTKAIPNSVTLAMRK